MLKVENITKSFGGVQAIKGSNFVIKKNKVTALIGPNGAGKTTLFDIIAGFVKPDNGSIIFENKDITKLPPHRRTNLGISRTFQQVRLFRYLTIEDHLSMTENNDDQKIFKNLFFKNKKNTKKHNTILKKFGIEHSINTEVSELSYGQRKLLELAMSLEKPHSLLMLDEPVAGVNKILQEHIENSLIEKKQAGETMLIIDHDMSFIRRLADHVIVLDAGEVLMEGSPEEVLNNKKVLEAYLGE